MVVIRAEKQGGRSDGRVNVNKKVEIGDRVVEQETFLLSKPK